MKTFEQLLKTEYGTRLSNGSRWLVWGDGEWVVYERPYGARETRVLCRDPDKTRAIAALIGE